MKPSLKIISGGQTGVDRVALEWALANGVPHGGWCPKGRKAEDGVIPLRFELKETESSDYPTRTRRNVRDSGGTVIFSVGPELSGGTRLTAEFAKKIGKPLLLLAAAKGVDDAASQLNVFLTQHDVRVLNVAGPRLSNEPAAAEFAHAVLTRALKP